MPANRISTAAPSHNRQAGPASRLLAWYDRNARDLPWRTGPRERSSGLSPDPYHVWLSEVMLQQTRVATVREYFSRFVTLWPTVADLAAAQADDVMRVWAGLGYYSRARNLRKCAEVVADRHGGRFPRTSAELRQLPGIGEYTAAAIAAIAFDEPVAVVDGNVERVVSRLFAIDTPPRRAKAEIRQRVRELLAPERPGDFAQAMMDLGATICAPSKPACLLCPVRADCTAFAAGTPDAYPASEPRPDRPQRRGAAFVATDRTGAVFLRKRPETGLLAGMAEVPTTGWTAKRNGATGVAAAPFPAEWRRAGVVRHVFTHFSLELEVWRAETTRAGDAGGWWSRDVGSEALPSIMKKVIEAAIPGIGKGDKIRS